MEKTQSLSGCPNLVVSLIMVTKVTFTYFLPLTISPSCKGRLSGIPWQITSFTEVQQDFGKL